MNFSFASAPTTPFIAQTDGRSTLGSHLLPPQPASGISGSISAGVSGSCATDPLNDIGSPINMPYLQFAIHNSPFFMSDSGLGTMGSPTSAALGLPPKRSQHPQPQQQQEHQYPQQQLPVIVTTSPSSVAMSALALASSGAAQVNPGLSPGIKNNISNNISDVLLAQSEADGPLPGFLRPSDVFTTPENRNLLDPPSAQRTPDLALFEDADSFGFSASTSAAITRVLSPRTQTAQAGLSLLAASATYAHSNSDLTQRMGSATPLMEAMGSPFLNEGAVNATLMSQPQNSLAQHLSPPIMDRGGMLGQGAVQLVGGSGRLTRNRSLLRQSSGLTSASFYNDLVPQATESFFAPLDEVCSDVDQHFQSQGFSSLDGRGGSVHQMALPMQTPMQQQLPMQRQQTAASGIIVPGSAPRMGSQFSPVINISSQRFQYQSQQQQQQQQQQQHQQRQWMQSPPPNLSDYNNSSSSSNSFNRKQQQSQQQSQYNNNNSITGPANSSSSQFLMPPLPPSQPSTVQPRHLANPNNKAPGIIFSQMPSLTTDTNTHPAPSSSTAAVAAAAAATLSVLSTEDTRHYSSESHGSESMSPSQQDDDDDDDTMDGDNGLGSKRRRTGTPHKRDQQRRFDCDVCNRSFARQYNLKTHRLTHFPNVHASRPFNCPHCTKAFTRKHDLQRHSVLHERKDKHTCMACQRGFPRKDALKKHLETEKCCQPV